MEKQAFYIRCTVNSQIELMREFVVCLRLKGATLDRGRIVVYHHQTIRVPEQFTGQIIPCSY